MSPTNKVEKAPSHSLISDDENGKIIKCIYIVKKLQKVTNTLFYTDEGVTFEDDIDEEDNMIFGQGTFNNFQIYSLPT
jgi:hypothetical protein